MRKWNWRSSAACVTGVLVGLGGLFQSALAFDGRSWANMEESVALYLPGPAAALARQVMASGDNAGLPFAIVDKQAAMVLVFRQDGRLVDKSTVLLGATLGDHATEGVGYRTQTGQLRPEDRTTPAGRFPSAPGRNLAGEAVVWIDYDKGLAIHRLRPAPLWQRRPERMASPDPLLKRISAGCVVVPENFYDQVVHPMLGQGRGVVYVLPESSAWEAALQTGTEGRQLIIHH